MLPALVLPITPLQLEVARLTGSVGYRVYVSGVEELLSAVMKTSESGIWRVHATAARASTPTGGDLTTVRLTPPHMRSVVFIVTSAQLWLGLGLVDTEPLSGNEVPRLSNNVEGDTDELEDEERLRVIVSI